jgi:YfiH family protein
MTTAPVSTLRFWQPVSSAAWPWLRARVTMRHGGASPAPYTSLNLGLSTGDDVERVHENRRRVQRALGVESCRIHTLHQVHGAEVFRTPTAARQGDGLWTAETGDVLVVGIADCVPVFLWDSEVRRIALVHAGWRGTAAGILGRALAELQRHGSRPEDLHVALGPSIGPCCYTVSADTAAQFPATAVQAEPGGFRLDLRAANRLQAEAMGLLPQHVESDPPCTGCNRQDFFSHRVEQGRTGRLWALLWMPQDA